MKYQYNYEFQNRKGEMIKGHCMTVFDTREQASRALLERIDDLEQKGEHPTFGEVVEVKEEEV